MLRVALTGGIGSGKTTVADRLAWLGAVIIDADELAREAVARGTAGLRQVVEAFGEGVRQPDGELDRQALARIVFADEDARKRLEAIIHPRVRRLCRELEEQADPCAIVVCVIPLLVETGQEHDFDVVVVVDVDLETQLRRVQTRDGLDAAAALLRIESQASREDRLAAADFVIGNDSSRAELFEAVDAVFAQLRRRAAGQPKEMS
ncbi:MAG: dephospho-CoA kinase [Propionibacteriaceae bacterium]|jgi:dephospho-CoA kinase|nr:dephospho-CoA kinase [Propionibacteriaceae bacterium]